MEIWMVVVKGFMGIVLIFLLSSCNGGSSEVTGTLGSTEEVSNLSPDLRVLINDSSTSLIHYFRFQGGIVDIGNQEASITTTGSPTIGDYGLVGNSIDFNGASDGQNDYFEFALSYCQLHQLLS